MFFLRPYHLVTPRPTPDFRLTTPLPLLTISTSFGGDPDLEYISDIVPSIPSGAHLAAFAVTPDDGDRADAITVQSRNRQQLDVKGCHARSRDDLTTFTIQPRPEQQIAGDLGAKELEPALRIVHPRDEQEAHQPIEHSSHQVPVGWLAEPPRPRTFSRPDGDVASPRQRGAQLGEIRQRGCEVGVA